MGNRLTLPLLLLAALLAGGAFFWMSGGERRTGPQGAREAAPAAPAAKLPAAELAHASESASVLPEAARAPVERQREEVAPKAAPKASKGTAGMRGRVVDRFGTPIPGARVTVAADAGFPLDMDAERDFPWLKRQRTETDADGQFRFEGVEPGTQHLGVKAKGFAPYDQRAVAVPVSGVELEPVTMVRGAILTGQVIDSDGRAVAGARIVRDDLDDGAGVFMLGAREAAAVSEADGRFRVDELACGPWRFIVRSDDHPDLAVEGVAEEPGVEVGGLRWQLVPGATIAGTLTGVPSAERDGLEVRATRAASGDFGFGAARVAKVETNGAFVLRGLQIGESYTLQARQAQSKSEFGFFERSRSNSVQARAGDSGVILAYQPEAALTFSVVDARTRAPIERLQVETGTEWLQALTDDDGRTRTLFPGGQVRAGGLRPASDSDRVQLTVKATGYEEMHRADIAVRAGQELDLGTIALEPVPVVRIKVTDKKNGKPIEGAVVRIQKQLGEGVHELRRSISISPDAGQESLDFGEGRSATTDSEGIATLTSYEGETVDVIARAKGFAPAKRAGLALPKGQTVEEELRLSLGGEVNVHVLDAQGVALAGVSVEHRAAGASPEGGTFALGGPRGGGEITDAEGAVLFENLAPGLHSFRLGDKDSGGATFVGAGDLTFTSTSGGDDDESWSQVQVSEGERSELTLRSAPRSTLAGRVREAGKVLPGATLALAKDSEGGGPDFRLPGMGGGGPESKSDGEGHYRIEDVKAGHYKLTVEHPTRRMPATFELDLREGDNTFDVDLPLSIVSGRVLDSEHKALAGVRVWPERAQPESGQAVRMRMILVGDDGGGGLVDSGQFGERAVSDAEGRYTLRGVTSDVDLVIKAEGDAVQPATSATVRVAPNEVKDGIDLTLEVAGSIHVEAKLADGSPARFQLVQAEYLDKVESPLEPKVSFMQAGSTELTGLKPGRWRVNIKNVQGGPGQNNPGQDKEIEVKPQEKATASFQVE